MQFTLFTPIVSTSSLTSRFVLICPQPSVHHRSHTVQNPDDVDPDAAILAVHYSHFQDGQLRACASTCALYRSPTCRPINHPRMQVNICYLRTSTKSLTFPGVTLSGYKYEAVSPFSDTKCSLVVLVFSSEEISPALLYPLLFFCRSNSRPIPSIPFCALRLLRRSNQSFRAQFGLSDRIAQWLASPGANLSTTSLSRLVFEEFLLRLLQF